MRYRKPVNRGAALGQFFTPPVFSGLLVAQLGRDIDSVLELGAGQGALAHALLREYPKAKLTLVEFDKRLHRGLEASFPDARVLHADVLNESVLSDQLGRRRYSAAIGNPPFTTFYSPSRTDAFNQRYGAACSSGDWHRADIVFCAASMERVAVGGQIALILAAPLVAHELGSGFRKEFLSKFADVQVFELPPKIYDLAKEVQTFLICGRRVAHAPRSTVRLASVDHQGNVRSDLKVTRKQASTRLDFSFHQRMRELGVPDQVPTLASLGAVIVRGSRSHAEFSGMGERHLHTCDLSGASTRFRLPGASASALMFKTVEAGDIVVPRVGTRCLTRQGLVERGGLPYSESLYRVRMPKQHRRIAFDAIEGPTGVAWRQLHAHGSCAKHLTHGDLLALPIV